MNTKTVGEVLRIPRTQVRPFAEQPRTFFDQKSLQELANSIKAVGQIIPILVKKLDPPVYGHSFELVDGQRRWHACDMADIADMDAIVITVKDANDQFIRSVIANLGREDNNTLEIAHAVKRIRAMGFSVENTRPFFGGKSTTWIYQHEKIADLPPEVQKLLGPETPEDKQLSFNTALILTDKQIPNEMKITLAKTISEMGLSMNSAKHLIVKSIQTQGIRRTHHRPGRDFNCLSSFILRTNSQLETTLDTTVPQMQVIWSAGKLQERMRVIERIEENIALFTELKDILTKVEVANKKTSNA